MKFSHSTLPGVMRIAIEPRVDERGFFARTYCVREFADAGIDRPMRQDSMAHSRRAGTLRGLHYHDQAFPQTRLLRFTSGSAFVALVDLRRRSTAYLQHETMTLSAAESDAVFVPPGIALGYQTLEDDSVVYYQMSELYAPAHERGVRWNDPALRIEWPNGERIINERDARYPDFDPDKHAHA